MSVAANAAALLESGGFEAVVSKSQLADLLKTTKPNLSNLISRGKIPEAAITAGGKVDVEKALRGIVASSDVALSDPDEAQSELIAPESTTRDDFNSARARKELATALSREFELERRAGAFVEKAETHRAIAEVWRASRDRLLNLPRGVAEKLGDRRIEAPLQEAIDAELRRLETEIRSLQREQVE